MNECFQPGEGTTTSRKVTLVPHELHAITSRGYASRENMRISMFFSFSSSISAAGGGLKAILSSKKGISICCVTKAWPRQLRWGVRPDR
jgi:hypothetical protein